MKIGIISSNPILTMILVDRFKLSNAVTDATENFLIFEKGSIILLENTANVSQCFSYLYEIFSPEHIFYVSFAF